MNGPHSRNLRLGRFSQSGQVYLLTMVGIDRSPVFADFFAARCVVRAMHESSVVFVAETLAFVVMPDHVHWRVQLKDGARLGEVVRRVKARVSLLLGTSRCGSAVSMIMRCARMRIWSMWRDTLLPIRCARASPGGLVITRIGMPCG